MKKLLWFFSSFPFLFSLLLIPIAPQAVIVGFVVSLYCATTTLLAYMHGRSDREIYFGEELQGIADEIIPPPAPNTVVGPKLEISEETRKCIRPYMLIGAIKMQLWLNRSEK